MNITLRVGRRLSRALTVTGAAALIAGLGLVAIAPGAIANPPENAETCDKLGYTKIDEASGEETFDFGTLTWGGDTLTYDINDGYVVDICIKGGTEAPTEETGLTGEGSIVRDENSISHIGYVFSVPSTTTSTTPTDTGSTTPSETTSTTPSETTSTTPSETTSTTPSETTSTTPSETTSTTPTDTGSTTPSETTSTTPTDTGSTTPSETTSTTPATTTTTSASVLPTVVTSTPAASTTPAVQPAVLARTGLETWTVALVAGLLLLGGGAMVALGTGAAPSTRRH
jgi:hypothetical protein